jgi:hypothetical protein
VFNIFLIQGSYPVKFLELEDVLSANGHEMIIECLTHLELKFNIPLEQLFLWTHSDTGAQELPCRREVQSTNFKSGELKP